MGWNGYLNYQLNYTRINDAALENAVAMRYPLTALPSDQLFDADGGQSRRSSRVEIYRAAFSHRQLYQRMVEFWTITSIRIWTRSAICSSPISAT